MSQSEAYSPSQLLKMMATTQFEYSEAIRKLRELEKAKMLHEARTNVIVAAKRFDLLENEGLRVHFQTACSDPKFRPTVDFIERCIYLENLPLMEEYNYYSKVAKQAEKEYEILSGQLIWHQSQAKIKGIELINKI